MSRVGEEFSGLDDSELMRQIIVSPPVSLKGQGSSQRIISPAVTHAVGLHMNTEQFKLRL